jgi:hypothetical protein
VLLVIDRDHRDVVGVRDVESSFEEGFGVFDGPAGLVGFVVGPDCGQLYRNLLEHGPERHA